MIHKLRPSLKAGREGTVEPRSAVQNGQFVLESPVLCETAWKYCE